MSIRPQIVIEVGPRHFVFMLGSEKLALEPIVTVSAEDRETILSVGEAPSTPGVISVRLFDPSQEVPSGIMKIDFLSAFIGYGIDTLLATSGSPGLSPRVLFRGCDTLRDILCGYQPALLELAALNGGAKEVAFD